MVITISSKIKLCYIYPKKELRNDNEILTLSLFFRLLYFGPSKFFPVFTVLALAKCVYWLDYNVQLVLAFRYKDKLC